MSIKDNTYFEERVREIAGDMLSEEYSDQWNSGLFEMYDITSDDRHTSFDFEIYYNIRDWHDKVDYIGIYQSALDSFWKNRKGIESEMDDYIREKRMRQSRYAGLSFKKKIDDDFWYSDGASDYLYHVRFCFTFVRTDDRVDGMTLEADGYYTQKGEEISETRRLYKNDTELYCNEPDQSFEDLEDDIQEQYETFIDRIRELIQNATTAVSKNTEKL